MERKNSHHQLRKTRCTLTHQVQLQQMSALIFHQIICKIIFQAKAAVTVADK